MKPRLFLTCNGVTQHAYAWARESELSASVIAKRVRSGKLQGCAVLLTPVSESISRGLKLWHRRRAARRLVLRQRRFQRKPKYVEWPRR